MTDGDDDPTLDDDLDPTLDAEEAPLFDGRYRQIALLGRGGFGEVMLVEDTLRKGRRVALKTILPEHSTRSDFKRRFDDEIDNQRRLRHENIPAVINDGVTEDGTFYFTMEFVEGVTLSSVVKKEGALAPDRIARIVRQVARVLDHAHGLGVVHRDLKPSNILLSNPGDEDEMVHVLDFGIAKLMQTEEDAPELTSQTMGFIGTPAYASPEQVSGMPSNSIDGRSDNYSLGILIHYMASGKLPFKGTTQQEIATARLNQAPEPLTPDQAPDDLRTVVEGLLQRDREQRAELADVTRTLGRLLGEEHEQRKHSSRVVAIVAVVAIAAVALVALQLGENGADPDGDGGTSGVEQAAFGLEVIRPPGGSDETDLGEYELIGDVTGGDSVTLRLVDEDGASTDVAMVDGRYYHTVPLPEIGTYSFTLIASTPTDDDVEESVTITRTPTGEATPKPTPQITPRLTWGTAASERSTEADTLTLTGRVDPSDTEVRIDGDEVTVDVDGNFEHTVGLPGLGKSSFPVELARLGETYPQDAIELERTEPPDRDAPQFGALTSSVGTATTELQAVLKCSISDPSEPITFRVERSHGGVRESVPEAAITFDDPTLTATVELEVGANTFTVTAEDAEQNRSNETITITRTLPEPSLRLSEDIDTSERGPGDASVEVRGTIENWTADRGIELRSKVNAGAETDRTASVSGSGEFAFTVDLVDGETTIALELWLEDRHLSRGLAPISIPKRPARLREGFSISAQNRNEFTDGDLPLRIRHDRSGIEAVLVVPVPAASLEPFYVGLTEVSRSESARIRSGADASLTAAEANLPLVDITFAEARELANDAGGRLPSLKEWCVAAWDGQYGNRVYPWGGEFDQALAATRENSLAESGPVAVQDDAFKRGRTPELGLWHVIGNVSEWTVSPVNDEKGSAAGGSFKGPGERVKITEDLGSPTTRGNEWTGLRIVFDPPTN